MDRAVLVGALALRGRAACHPGATDAQTTPEKCEARPSKRARPSTPCSPVLGDSHAPDSACAALSGRARDWAESVCYSMSKCVYELGRANKKCKNIVADPVVRLAWALYWRHFQNEKGNRAALSPTVLVACVWVALKFDAARNFLPSASLMYAVSGVKPADLRVAEVQVLLSIKWEVCKLAVEAGIIPSEARD